MNNVHVFTDIEDKYIIENYNTKTIRQISDALRLTDAQIRHRIQRHLNITPSKRKKHFPNEEFFFNDSKEFYYILGLIYADGNLYRDSNTHCKISISLNSNDIYLLNKINSLFCDTNLVSSRKNSNMSELVLYNKRIYERLESFGLTQNKSLIVEYPIIPEKYIPNFILGYFDGDGSITKRKDRNGFYIQFLGTEMFLNGIVKSLENKFNFGLQNINSTNTKIKCLRYSTKKAKTILSWLYENNNIYLLRKYEKFKPFI